MQNNHILIIEDDPKIINFLSLALKAKGYRLSAATTGQDGILNFCTVNPNIIMLDLGLPDIDGVAVIEGIRKVSQIPILVLSAREQAEDKITALDAGANDYITKPFNMGELLARIRVMERFIIHEKTSEPADVYRFLDLTIYLQKHRVFLGEDEVHLTPLEYKLLVLLASNYGKVITHRQIIKEVWGYSETGDTKSIRVCMTSLRRKIETDTSHPKFIFTEIGIGYRFTDTRS
ncbi:MAG: response regulator [Oscillospiraceae bacterium]|nr:response regulator [Oscillospiraceae bacterium]